MSYINYILFSQKELLDQENYLTIFQIENYLCCQTLFMFDNVLI